MNDTIIFWRTGFLLLAIFSSWFALRSVLGAARAQYDADITYRKRCENAAIFAFLCVSLFWTLWWVLGQ